MKPFRWNIAKREQLGRLTDIEPARTYPGFHNDLRATAARIVARAGDSDYVFVGRSPELIYDYLSGIFDGVPDAPALKLLQFSSPGLLDSRESAKFAAEIAAMEDYLRVEKLDPHTIAAADKTIRFIDFVSRGQTFGELVRLLKDFTEREKADWNAVRRRIGFVGLTWQTHTSPKTWRWWQHQVWLGMLDRPRIKNISVPGSFWGYAANNNEKVTRSHQIWMWNAEEATEALRADWHMRALRLAAEIHESGRDVKERTRFVQAITALPEMRDPWLRSLVLRIKRPRAGS